MNPLPLSSSQRKKIRQLGQKMADDVQLGKAGLSDGFTTTIQRLLAEKELVKLRFGKDYTGDLRDALAEEVATATQSVCAAITGRTMLLYKANPDLEPAKRVAW